MFDRRATMKKMWHGGLVVVLAVVIGAAGAMFLGPPKAAQARADDAKVTGGPRYTVLDTEGHNLIVTDNSTNTVYFYTVDKGKEAGDDLKLRGTIDLKQVGKAVIKPTKAKD
jgi:hypothetical protein